MASKIEKFKKYLIGSEDQYIDYVGIISPSGELRKVTNLEAILNSWMNILRTPKGTHLYDPEFGSNLHKFIFEPVTEETAEAIREDIYDSIMNYDDRASIDSIDVLFFKDRKGFVVEITAKYGNETKKIKVPILDLIYPTETA